MDIVVGPVDVESARVWLAYARDALTHLRTVEGDHELPAGALGAFEDLLDEWDVVAKRDETFHWTSDEPPERAEFLISSLYHAGNVMEREAIAGRHPARTAATDQFHLALISSVLVALAAQGPPFSEFAEQLRTTWGLDLG